VRYNWLKKIGSITSPVDTTPIFIYDVLNVDWSSFEFTNGYIVYKLTAIDVQRPWMITDRFYGSPQYEDLVYLVNHIENPLDLVVGQELKIPGVVDIVTFLNKVQQTQ